MGWYTKNGMVPTVRLVSKRHNTFVALRVDSRYSTKMVRQCVWRATRKIIWEHSREMEISWGRRKSAKRVESWTAIIQNNSSTQCLANFSKSQ